MISNIFSRRRGFGRSKRLVDGASGFTRLEAEAGGSAGLVDGAGGSASLARRAGALTWLVDEASGSAWLVDEVGVVSTNAIVTEQENSNELPTIRLRASEKTRENMHLIFRDDSRHLDLDDFDAELDFCTGRKEETDK
ncbi:hypothetical protein PoB_000319400 [Plakobranchus ocellatus]|uniref:Uncharacterized protein n=1 Tax=Plakobranchus ocellatus TaxID=259542 RepID=A0AAV3Y3N2_9GAST|nr:hypothetical protein PoB_000319400 [Plakobranchus ocellatus]